MKSRSESAISRGCTVVMAVIAVSGCARSSGSLSNTAKASTVDGSWSPSSVFGAASPAATQSAQYPPFIPVSTTIPLTMVNAASYQAGIAPGSYAAIFGSALSSVTGTAQEPVPTPGALSQPLPLSYAGLSVTVGSQRAALGYVSTSQINILVPPALGPGTYPYTITQVNTTIAQGQVTLIPHAPGIFTVTASGVGTASALAWNGGGSATGLVFKPQASPPANTDPLPPIAIKPTVPGSASPGQTQANILELYVTGLNDPATNSACKSVSFDGLAVPVVYDGPQGQYEGLDQVNVPIPTSIVGTSPKIVNVAVLCGNVSSNWARICVGGTQGVGSCPSPTPAKLTAVWGTGQAMKAQNAFGLSFVAHVVDSVGQPIDYLPITWSDPTGTVDFSGGTSITAYSGQSNEWDNFTPPVTGESIITGRASYAGFGFSNAALTASVQGADGAMSVSYQVTSIDSDSQGRWAPGFWLTDSNGVPPSDFTAAAGSTTPFTVNYTYATSGPMPNGGFMMWLAPQADGSPGPTARCANGVDEMGTVLTDATGATTCELQFGPVKGKGTLYWLDLGWMPNSVEVTVN